MKKSVRSPLARAFSLALALLMLLSVLSACKSTDDTNTPNSDPGTSAGEENATSEEKLAAEQVLNLNYTELQTIDVNASVNSNEIQVLTEVQEGLFRCFSDENGVEVVENAGCTSFEISDDGLVYTFHLREESVWSDGVPVTAQNYKDSWMRMIDPEGTFSYAGDLLGIVGATAYYNGEGSADDVAMECVDEYTFRVTLEAPDSTFIKRITSVAFYPIRKDLIDAAEAAGADWATDYTLHAFNGPFVISDRVMENSMTLTKNETYWDAENVILTQVNLQVVAEVSTRAQLVEIQQLDATTMSDYEYVEKWQPLVDAGTLVHVTTDTPATYFLVLCQHDGGNGGLSGLMLNDKVRLAMSLALDREEFIDLFRYGYNTPAYGLIPYAMTVGDTEFRPSVTEPLLESEYASIAADPAALRALFEEGCLEEGHSGNAEDETLVTMVYNPSTEKSNMLEWFKQQFESKLGCKVEIVVCPDLSAEQTARAEYQYDFYQIGWGASFNDPLSLLEMFVTGGSYSKLLGGFSDAEYDSLVEQIKSSMDDDERSGMIAEAENILITKAGIVPLYYSSREVFYQPYIKNLSLPTFGAVFEFSRAYIVEH